MRNNLGKLRRIWCKGMKKDKHESWVRKQKDMKVCPILNKVKEMVMRTPISEIRLTHIPKENEIKQREWIKEKNDKTMKVSWTCPHIKKKLINKTMNAQLR
jgi:hypothetical protein